MRKPGNLWGIQTIQEIDVSPPGNESKDGWEGQDHAELLSLSYQWWRLIDTHAVDSRAEVLITPSLMEHGWIPNSGNARLFTTWVKASLWAGMFKAYLDRWSDRGRISGSRGGWGTERTESGELYSGTFGYQRHNIRGLKGYEWFMYRFNVRAWVGQNTLHHKVR